jgi:DNA-binding IclR family transcriptional regulator
MKKWQIQALFFNEGWECPEEHQTFYDTKEEAMKELDELLADLEEAVELGYMTDYSAHDWRVAEVDVQE